MKRLILKIWLIFALSEMVTANLAKQKLYKSENGKIYYIDEEYQFTWIEAVLECSMKKMSLLTLETPEEYDDVVKILKEPHFSFQAPHLWIGAVGVNKQFTWIANSQPVFTNKWLEDHNPDNWNKEENCIHFWENTTSLNDRKCDYKYGFICEENSYSNSELQKCNNIVFNIVNDYK